MPRNATQSSGENQDKLVLRIERGDGTIRELDPVIGISVVLNILEVAGYLNNEIMDFLGC